MRKILFLFFFVTTLTPSQGQVLISLILGDELNTGNIEFGLDGGVNFPEIKGLDGKAKANFNLGFYFDIKTKKPNWLFHTGVMVKSTLGTAESPVYLLNDASLDSAFKNGEVQRKIGYFNVPIMMKYKISNVIFAEGGIMPALRSGAKDVFTAEVNGNELEYKKNIKDQIHSIDFGLIAGLGYRLMKGNGMNLSIQYYYGLTDITTEENIQAQYHRSFYITAGIPIGAGKAKEKAKEKEEGLK